MTRTTRSLLLAVLFISGSWGVALCAYAQHDTDGTWIGGLKSADQRVLAILLHRTRDKNKLDIWLKTGELRSLELLQRRTTEATTEFRTAGGDNIFSLALDDHGLLQGKGFLATDHIEGIIRLTKVGDDSGAAARYERIWQEDFLGPESYQFLGIAAANSSDIPKALVWLQRGRASKRPITEALMFSAALNPVRQDPRFREFYSDPVALHPELSQATHSIRVERSVQVPMRDKVRLIADIYRPDGPGRYPVILIRTPYGRGADIPPDGVDHFAPRGYVVVIQAVRGVDGSEGQFQPWLNERKDGFDTTSWVSRQAWSNGRVGMLGLSYLGQAQWAAAVEAHPALKCIIPEVSGTDHLLDTPYDHGILRLDMLSWLRNMNPKPKGMIKWPQLDDSVLTGLPLSKLDKIYTGQTLPLWQLLLDLDTSDKWSSANFLADLSRVRIPVLNISGWWDGEASATTTNYTAMRALGRENQWLIYGPWAHVWNQSTKFRDQEYGPTARIDFRSLSVRWFDQWLKQKQVGVEDIPKVQVFVTGANEWRNLTDWPDRNAKAVNLYLAPAANPEDTVKLLAPNLPTGSLAPATYVYNPADQKLAGDGTIPQTSTTLKIDPAARDLLLYKSEPFESATTISGPAALDLWFSTSAHDVDFFVVVFDQDPSGIARALSGPGKMRMKYMKGWDSPHPLTPGQIYHGKIDLRPFAHRFSKGHRIGILIRSEWFPSYERNLNTGAPIKHATRMEVGNIRLFHGASHPSVLRLWELPPGPYGRSLE